MCDVVWGRKLSCIFVDGRLSDYERRGGNRHVLQIRRIYLIHYDVNSCVCEEKH